MERLFLDVAGVDQEVDWMELKRILDHSMRDGKLNLHIRIRYKLIVKLVLNL